jgi:hypothetical protein
MTAWMRRYDALICPVYAKASLPSGFDQHQPEFVVGRSRGGEVAMNINSGATPLVLMRWAWKR